MFSRQGVHQKLAKPSSCMAGERHVKQNSAQGKEARARAVGCMCLQYVAGKVPIEVLLQCGNPHEQASHTGSIQLASRQLVDDAAA